MRNEIEYVPITHLLEEIIDNRGKSVPTVENGFPLIATNCIKHSSIYPTFENVRFVSEQTLKTWFRSHLKPNDILFVNKGTPGRVCLVPNPVSFCAAQDMMGFRCDKEKINYKYLFTVLRSNAIQKKIENNHVGLVIPHFRKQELSELMIPLRSEEEQESIGNLYITLSEKIELNNRINAELEAMAKTLYDYWFVQFDFPDENGKPYKSSGGKMHYNAELKREFPEGWANIKMSDLYQFQYGLGNTNPDNGGIYPIYGSNGIIGGYDKFNNEDSPVIGHIGANCGSLVFAKGKHYVTYNGVMCKIKANFNKYFGYITLLSKDLKSRTRGSSQPFISYDMLNEINVTIPDSKTMKLLCDLLNPSFDQIINNELQNQQLAELRDWLLPMLMNGQVTVKDEAR